jgi:cytochrome P450
MCQGRALALLEGHLVLATILQERRIELVAGSTGVPDTTISVQPAGGMMVSTWPR